ncbi:phosphate import ATP-binding protein pstB [Streptococcus pyogenes]|nr:phosphate import ATP-binding protein pstB [Streptococcus pyogenes]
MIEFKHVSKLYGDKEALSDLNVTINDGEIFGLIGHNGAGKTTTISILLLLSKRVMAKYLWMVNF